MNRPLAALLAFSWSLYVPAAHAKPQVIEGIISGYECGDNCYLTVTDTRGQEHVGLCAAKLCEPWNEKVEMPSKFKGKKVRVTVGRGVQSDGSGNPMGEMEAFEKIDLVK